MVARLRLRARIRAFRSPLTRVMSPLSIATSVPVPMADANIGLGQRRRVIHAVTGHGNNAAFGLKLFDDRQFLFRQDFSFKFSNAEFFGDGLGRGAIVTRKHDQSQAAML